jgi:hypothetical protein
VARLTLEEYKSIFDVNEGGQVRARYGMVEYIAKQPRAFAMNGTRAELAAQFLSMGLTGLSLMLEGRFADIKSLDHHQQAICRRVSWPPNITGYARRAESPICPGQPIVVHFDSIINHFQTKHSKTIL